MNVQEKFMKRMEEVAQERNLDFVQNPNWANTGTVLFQEPGSFTPLIAFDYAFQTAYASFGPTRPYPGRGVPNPKPTTKGGRNEPYWPYTTFDEVDGFIDTLTDWLDAAIDPALQEGGIST